MEDEREQAEQSPEIYPGMGEKLIGLEKEVRVPRPFYGSSLQGRRKAHVIGTRVKGDCQGRISDLLYDRLQEEGLVVHCSL